MQDQLLLRGSLEKALGHKPSAVNLSNDSPMPKVPSEICIFLVSVSREDSILLIMDYDFYVVSADKRADKGDCYTRIRGYALGAVSLITLPKSFRPTSVRIVSDRWRNFKKANEQPIGAARRSFKVRNLFQD